MSKLLEQVIEAVLSCKEIMNEPFSITEKEGISNIVTTADKKVEEHLYKSLLKILPEAAFLGEEGQQADGGEYCFIVDPIDGTANFSRGYHNSAVSVGLTKNGEGILGVVYNPFTDEIYYAEKGCGAFKNGERISVSKRDFAHGLYYTALSLYKKDLAGPCLRILEKVYKECNDFRREGTASIELCRLASGLAELYFEIRVFPWDVAAAEVILKEAGGCFINLNSGSLNSGVPFPIVAANSQESLEKLYKIVSEELNREV